MTRPRLTVVALASAVSTLLACRATKEAATDDAPAQPVTEKTPVEEVKEQTPAEEQPLGPEHAYLATHPDQDDIIAEARAEAKECDAGDQRGCRALANRYEEGIGAPTDRARAVTLYRRGCEQGSGYDCTLAGWVLTATRDPDERNQGLDLLRKACELDQLHACVAAANLLAKPDGTVSEEIASLRAKACRGGYQVGCDAGIEPDPQPREPPDAHAVCPASFHWSTSQSGGPRLHGAFGQLDPELLLAAIPSELPGFETKARDSAPADQGSTRISAAFAEYASGERMLSLSIRDRCSDCTLQPGTGEAMVRFVVEDRGGRRLEFDGSPGVLVGPLPSVNELPDTLGLTIWVADRCTVSLSAMGVDEQLLLTLAEHVDLASLREPCSQRPPLETRGTL